MLTSTKIIERITKTPTLRLRPRKGARISLIYFDLERESVRVQAFNGLCSKRRFRGINTCLSLTTSIRSYRITKKFFLHSPVILDWKIIKNK